jgi:hypothetical protein
MSDLGVSVGTIGALSRLIRAPRRTKKEREFREFWRAAKARTNPVPAYLGVAPFPGEERRIYYHHSFGLFEANNGLVWAVMNLTVTFGQLKA